MYTAWKWEKHQGRTRDGDLICGYYLINHDQQILAEIDCPQVDEVGYRCIVRCMDLFERYYITLEAAKSHCEERCSSWLSREEQRKAIVPKSRWFKRKSTL